MESVLEGDEMFIMVLPVVTVAVELGTGGGDTLGKLTLCD